MNWLFKIILHNNIFNKFIPKQDIDKKFIEADKLNEKQPERDYYENLSNMH